MTTLLENMLSDGPYQGYSYAYPHKTAYRPFARPVPLADVWQHERNGPMFLYFHVPFCEMRCGFCNLFTLAGARSDLANDYLDTLAREVDQVRRTLSDLHITRFAIGGGTPTYLEPAGLERLFGLAEACGVAAGSIPISVETSPDTADADRLGVLRDFGVSRVSIGVQSFDQDENARVFRPQQNDRVDRALKAIRHAGIATLNIDLMYGLPGQTAESWQHSLRRALEYQPEELYIYPLYVRSLTTLERSRQQWDDQRLHCYRSARDHLRASGYRQISMRMFRRHDAPDDGGPEHCCQTDGMLGLGCGARSYTQTLHYSREYAVRAQSVRKILNAYLERSDDSFAQVDYGFELGSDDQRRRFVVQSLLQADGLDVNAYHTRFSTDVFDDFAQLHELAAHGLALRDHDRLHLTDAGMERSDTIGPWLYSPHVRGLMEHFEMQ